LGLSQKTLCPTWYPKLVTSLLSPDGPRVHLSDPAYMPSSVRPEVTLPLDQGILCSDCCKKNIGDYVQTRWSSLILYCIAATYLCCLRPKLHICVACCSDSQMELIEQLRSVYFGGCSKQSSAVGGL